MKTIVINPMKDPGHISNYWKKEKFAIVIVFISGIIYNVGMLAGPIFQGNLIDDLVAGKSLKTVIFTALFFVVTITLLQVFRYIKRFYIRRFANNTSAVMRFMIYNDLVHKKERQLNEEKLGSLMTKTISDVDACVEGMRKFTTEIFDSGVLMISYITALAFYDVKLTIVSCIFTPFAMLCAEKLKKTIYGYTTTYRKAASEIAEITYDRIENAALYRITGREEENLASYDKKLDEFEKKSVIANLWENSMQPVYNVIAMSGIVFVIVMGGGYVLSGKWTVGNFSTYATMFAAMAFKASKTSKLFNSVQKARISWKRIQPYFVEYHKTDKSCNVQKGELQVSIQNLTFGYSEKEHILEDISLEADKGQWIGVTGPVACGKSTFGKLFLGEYKYDGNILINQKNITEYNEFERSKLIGYLGHSPQLMSDTIYNNITLGDEGDISKVLKLVCFEEDIRTMEYGIHTMVGNGGVRLSGGQQARIALARVLYHEPEILILDDPFSAVDENTEIKIIDNLQQIKDKHILILISHRLKMFDRMDQILVMSENKMGTHEELLMKSPLYTKLYQLLENEGGDDFE